MNLPGILEVGGFYKDILDRELLVTAALWQAIESRIRWVEEEDGRRIKSMGSLPFHEIAEKYVMDYLLLMSINHKQDVFREEFAKMGAVERDSRVVNGNSGNKISWFVCKWQKNDVLRFCQNLHGSYDILYSYLVNCSRNRGIVIPVLEEASQWLPRA